MHGTVLAHHRSLKQTNRLLTFSFKRHYTKQILTKPITKSVQSSNQYIKNPNQVRLNYQIVSNNSESLLGKDSSPFFLETFKEGADFFLGR